VVQASVRLRGEVRHIAGVRFRALGVVNPVVVRVRVEVAAGRGKRRPFAFSGLVNVDGVLAGGQIFQSQLNLDAGLPGACEGCGADAFALGVLTRLRLAGLQFFKAEVTVKTYALVVIPLAFGAFLIALLIPQTNAFVP